MAIPWGFQPKGGRMRLRWGYLNEFHQHDRPFIDNPNVYVRFFGEEGLVENGAEIAWVAPTPVYLQAIAGIFDGDNDVAFGGGTLRDPLVTGRRPPSCHAAHHGVPPPRSAGRAEGRAVPPSASGV